MPANNEESNLENPIIIQDNHANITTPLATLITAAAIATSSSSSSSSSSVSSVHDNSRGSSPLIVNHLSDDEATSTILNHQFLLHNNNNNCEHIDGVNDNNNHQHQQNQQHQHHHYIHSIDCDYYNFNPKDTKLHTTNKQIYHKLQQNMNLNDIFYNNNNNNNNNNQLSPIKTIDKINININNNNINDINDNKKLIPRWISHPIRSQHTEFMKKSIEEILNTAIFQSTEHQSKLIEWHDPNELCEIFDMKLKNQSDNDEILFQLIQNIIKYSVKTGHPYFINQLYSSIDPYAFIGQLLTDALNPSVYTYEVAPVFILMEEMVLKEMRQILGYNDGDGIFCPGGSMSNGYAISCARYKFMPDIKMKGLFGLPRLIVFTSEDSHYSVQKLSSFMGIGINNVYKIKTDHRGKMIMQNLQDEIERAKSEGGVPFLLFATGGTTVLGAFDPIDECANICEKYQMWLHVDAAWGGGVLMSKKYRKLLKGIERADSVTWNPHKMLSAAQQCSTFLTKHKTILGECHSTNAAYLFQKDKFYDTKFDTGDKHIQCGRRADVLKFWFMWRAKGTDGLTAHVEHIFKMAEYFTEEIKKRHDFEMVLENPECTNISFWYVPPSLQNLEKNTEYYERLHKIAPKVKERMMKEGVMMITYQSIKGIPNFFRLVLQNSVLNENDMLHFINEIERLGQDL